MTTESYAIVGGDYERAGAASRRLKDVLKRVGAEPDVIRRAMIAAYEAEMNVVIYAQKGHLRYTLGADRIDVDVEDEGPGIPDVALAMKEGYSTAPPAAREHGFGAGMGLPNIKKSSDRFRVFSNAGRGTRVSFSICLKAQETAESWRHSVRVSSELCRECSRCLHACPTGAVRLRPGSGRPGALSGPEILPHLCIDCASCVAACPAGVFGPACDAALPGRREDMVLVVPPAFLAQFGPDADGRRVRAELGRMGFAEVLVTSPWERALGEAVLAYARAEARAKPVISPACPVVVNLIEMRFPSLIGHLAPFLGPLDAVADHLGERRAAFVILCPGQRTALVGGDSPRRHHALTPGTLRGVVIGRLRGAGTRADEGAAEPPLRDQRGDVLRVTGIRHVMRVLEEVEDGLLSDVDVLELAACDGGCFGSPLLGEQGEVARRRWMRAPVGSAEEGIAVRRKTPHAPRAGLRLDADMGKAIVKLSQIDALMRGLPGRDCGLCGAPTCAAFAEDVVFGRIGLESCPHRGDTKGRTP